MGQRRCRTYTLRGRMSRRECRSPSPWSITSQVKSSLFKSSVRGLYKDSRATSLTELAKMRERWTPYPWRSSYTISYPIQGKVMASPLPPSTRMTEGRGQGRVVVLRGGLYPYRSLELVKPSPVWFKGKSGATNLHLPPYRGACDDG